jgi:hypothetical protein
MVFNHAISQMRIIKPKTLSSPPSNLLSKLFLDPNKKYINIINLKQTRIYQRMKNEMLCLPLKATELISFDHNDETFSL